MKIFKKKIIFLTFTALQKDCAYCNHAIRFTWFSRTIVYQISFAYNTNIVVLESTI